MNNGIETLSLRVCDTRVGVCSHNTDATALLVANYSEMRVDPEPADIEYTIGKDSICNSFFIATKGGNSFKAEQDGEFLYLFDRELTIELQKLRPDLYFVHGAALEYEGKVCLFVGPSKSGKSVTTWALLNEGFRYLSDELAPVDPKTLDVYPYPRALWLRRRSPGPQLPLSHVQTSWMVYVPTKTFSGAVGEKPIPLGAIFFVRHIPEASRPSSRAVGKAEAAARILASTLNPGAHPEDGLATAVDVARRTPCFEILTAALPETCSLIKDTLTACA